jgi:hypothetical protein
MKFMLRLLTLTIIAGTLGLGAAAQAVAADSAKLTAPLTGSGRKGASFNGTFSISRFELEGRTLKAVGMVRGVVSRGSAPVGSIVHGPIKLPVTSIKGGSLPSVSGAVVVRQQTTCEVLNLELGGLDLNLLGLQVTLDPIGLDIVGGDGPLGSLICEIVALLDSLVGIVGLLNDLLGLVGGLLGG